MTETSALPTPIVAQSIVMQEADNVADDGGLPASSCKQA